MQMDPEDTRSLPNLLKQKVSVTLFRIACDKRLPNIWSRTLPREKRHSSCYNWFTFIVKCRLSFRREWPQNHLILHSLCKRISSNHPAIAPQENLRFFRENPSNTRQLEKKKNSSKVSLRYSYCVQRTTQVRTKHAYSSFEASSTLSWSKIGSLQTCFQMEIVREINYYLLSQLPNSITSYL